ncbi:hypothetical protein QQM79_10025 [Marinobacteraceae bacterium S3BR75-40.1]
MSKQDSSKELIVVRYKPGHRIRRFLILLGFSLVAAVAGFFLGGAQYDFRYQEASQTRDVLQEQVKKLRDENSALKQKLVTLERSHRIDQQAIRETRSTIEDLQGQIKGLKGDVTFYRNIMAPSSTDTGLQVQRMAIQPTKTADHFNYKLVLTQIGDNRSYIEGVVAVNIIGDKNGERAVIPLRELSKEVEELGVRFRFRYFQDVEGVMVVPDDFEPGEIQVVAKAQGRKSARVEKTFDWQALTGR